MTTDPLLAELDALGVTLGGDPGRPFLRVPAGVRGRRRAELLQRVAARREAVIAHLKAARPAAPPAPDSWECVACGRELTPDLIPLLAGPHYCARAGSRRRVTTADGVVFEPSERCPFKPDY